MRVLDVLYQTAWRGDHEIHSATVWELSFRCRIKRLSLRNDTGTAKNDLDIEAGQKLGESFCLSYDLGSKLPRAAEDECPHWIKPVVRCRGAALKKLDGWDEERKCFACAGLRFGQEVRASQTA